ncbi:MAG: PaaI family thioesterase [Firmicutes bacterium]|nr:PaaI family thioesterase [Bacillota bacterium]
MKELDKIREKFSKDRFATETTGIEITEVGDNFAKVELDLDERHYNALGSVMGGVLFTMADFAFAVATNSGSESCVTLGSHISFIRSTSGKHLTAVAECVKKGRSTSFYLVKVSDESGKLVAQATTDGYILGA